VFVMMVEVDGYEPSSGEGPSKRAAEQTAAASFLQREGVWP
jgi:ribonuclease-3